MRTLEAGAQLPYVFDLGDDWTHCCTVEGADVDPEEVLGLIPPAPVAYWGWGSMADQYDRSWAQDDGQGSAPSRPRQRHAMVNVGWPGSGQGPPLVEVARLRVAAAGGDVAGILAELQGHDAWEVLQRAGSAVQEGLRVAPERVSSLASSLAQRQETRNLPGDEELAQDLLAAVRRESPPGRPFPVDLEELSGLLEGDPASNQGGFLDLATGR
jgi:hypothetical protein